MDSIIRDIYLTKVLITESHDESDMSNPEEREEVKIGKNILNLINACETTDVSYKDTLDKIRNEVNKLLALHKAM